MTDTIRFDDLAVGTEIPSLVKNPTSRQLVMYAGASGDYNPIHYDRDAAAARGLPDIVVHGQLVSACLMQLLSDWLGDAGSIKRFSVSYKAMTFPGEPFTCRGTVTKVPDTGDKLVTLSIWAENPRGEKTVSGTAVVEFFPSATAA
ncbi:MaoC/PaaZ C-terminal domain-containing protein [Dehalogenimonas sp. THU2]|uniref:MaoC/PaaZ C-terminal domain-containing protein n=1 Tax=Dehalogenimonas sp. THU2 TaxID=3151121 RepID=UPI0032186252